MTNLIGVATVTGEANKQPAGAKLPCTIKDGSVSNFVALDGSQWVRRALSHVPAALVAFPCFVAVKVVELVVQQLQQVLEAHKSLQIPLCFGQPGAPQPNEARDRGGSLREESSYD